MRSLLCVAAGAFFSLSHFVFVDGFLVAKHVGTPYSFLMCLPGSMIMCAILLLVLTDLNTVTGRNDLYSTGATRDKVFFFIAALLILGGAVIAVWKAIDPYADTSSSLPGVLLVTQCLFLVFSSGFIFLHKLQDEGYWG